MHVYCLPLHWYILTTPSASKCNHTSETFTVETTSIYIDTVKFYFWISLHLLNHLQVCQDSKSDQCVYMDHLLFQSLLPAKMQNEHMFSETQDLTWLQRQPIRYQSCRKIPTHAYQLSWKILHKIIATLPGIKTGPRLQTV